MAAKRRLDVVCASVLCATGSFGAKLRWQRSDGSVLCATRCCVRRVDAERSSDGSEATARCCVRLVVLCDGWKRSEAPPAAKGVKIDYFTSAYPPSADILPTITSNKLVEYFHFLQL